MCFSATGSFAIAGVLTVVGAASVARTSSKRHRMFAAIPLLFAAQQAAEGTVWLTMDGAHPLVHGLAVSIFLGVALIVWPTWLPFALRLVERNAARRRALGLLFWAGVGVAVYATMFVVRFRPVAKIAGHSIRYDYATSGDELAGLVYLLAYAAPTVVPFFLSTVSMARTIGAMLVVSLVASIIVQRDALTSVWCFFAAMLSGIVLLAVAREQRRATPLHAAPST